MVYASAGLPTHLILAPRPYCVALSSRTLGGCTPNSSLVRISRSSSHPLGVSPSTFVRASLTSRTPEWALNYVPVGNPAFVRDESKELTLRVHDECQYPGSSLPFQIPGHADSTCDIQVTVLTSSVRTFAHVSRTSCLPSRSASGPPNGVVLALSCTSGRKVALWVK